MNSQGEVALILDFDPATGQVFVTGHRELQDLENTTLQSAYLSATDDEKTQNKIHEMFEYVMKEKPENTESGEPVPRNIRVFPSHPTKHLGRRSRSPSPASKTSKQFPEIPEEAECFAKTKKKYKPVDKKVRPVAGELPQHYRIVRNHVGDPLEEMPELSRTPKDFEPIGRYTQERRDKLRAEHPWLSPEELDLLDDLMCKQNEGFAWDDSERGRFRHDMFPPVKLAVIRHEPWRETNFPVPPGIYRQICEMMKKKMQSGVYEPSNASYRSRWFCVLKKDGSL